MRGKTKKVKQLTNIRFIFVAGHFPWGEPAMRNEMKCSVAERKLVSIVQ